MSREKALFNHFIQLLEVEKEAEKEENKKEIDRLPEDIREALGKTVTRLIADREDVGVGGLPLLVLARHPSPNEDLSPFHAMDRGDLVRLSFSNGWPAVDGTLYDVQEYQATVALNRELEDLPTGRCRIDLLGTDITYKRMREALETARDAGGRLGELRNILTGERKPSAGPEPELKWFDPGLNRWQKQGVRCALAAEDVAVIHGPPGTGKTTVLIEIIRQAAAAGQRVLASAPSNVAVDNILEKVLDKGLRVVRLGHPARTFEALRHATLMAQVAAHPDQDAIFELDQERERLVVQRNRKARRGQGLHREETRVYHERIQNLWREARGLERSLSKRILKEAQVVLATHGSIGSMLGAQSFDLAVLDEASQASEPLSWIPIVRAKKLVLAGDPLQLPPTLYSEEAKKAGLGTTLMERLMPELGPKLKVLLRTQYRMNQTIMGFSSERFYGGKLEADESVKDHLACELRGARKTDLTEVPFVFIDTAGAGYAEVWNELLDSRENEGEASLALKVWEQLSESGLHAYQGAIITPYAAQARLLKPRVPKGLEVGTVDGFQGREKEAVIVSLVRSNDEGQVGFLSDTRRMNVAMTRARRLLIVIGDSATISRHPFYAAFLEYAEKNGSYRSAYEWMS